MSDSNEKTAEQIKAAKLARLASLTALFQKALVDQLAARATNGVLQEETGVLDAAANAAMIELVDSEIEPISPMMAVGVWRSTIKTNASAYWQGLERKKDLPFKLTKTRRTVADITADYL